ncbi:hypothetical protein AB6A40_009729 [Gnathostoma spinigerum]|uniref:Secreted protein n=1 Tax=Gnathostoma spinigerum TaxID=75299 RepID=A0ABD6EU25_9BILA
MTLLVCSFTWSTSVALLFINVTFAFPDDQTSEKNQFRSTYLDGHLEDRVRREDLFGDDGQYSSTEFSLLQWLSKRSVRLCGLRLVSTVLTICGGCVKPMGSKPVSLKRTMKYPSSKFAAYYFFS